MTLYMENMKKAIFGAILVTEISHIFCCVLPTLFSLLSLLVAAGMISTMPPGLTFMHDFIHGYEMTIIVASAFVLAFGWALHGVSKMIDCRNTGCVHEPCVPKKKMTSRVLIIASILFAFNISIYFGFHYQAEKGAVVLAQDHDNDRHNH